MPPSVIEDDELGGVPLTTFQHEIINEDLIDALPLSLEVDRDVDMSRWSHDSVSDGGVALTQWTMYARQSTQSGSSEENNDTGIDSDMTDCTNAWEPSDDAANIATQDQELSLYQQPNGAFEDAEMDMTELDFDAALEDLIETTNRASRLLDEHVESVQRGGSTIRQLESHSSQQEDADSDDVFAPSTSPSQTLQNQQIQQIMGRHSTEPQASQSTQNQQFIDLAFSNASEEVPDSSPLFVSNAEDHVMLGGERIDYSVLDFLHDWDWQSQMSQVSHVNLTSHRLSGWRASGDVEESDTVFTRRDMQGLDWNAFETTRRLARTTRNTLYRHQTLINAQRKSDADPSSTRKARQYRFKQTLIKHRPQMMHWQLRNVLAATDRNNIFYAARDKVIRTSLTCPSMADTMIDLGKPLGDVHRTQTECRITTLASTPPPTFSNYSSDAVVVAGGYGGEYAFLNLHAPSSTKPTYGIVSHAPDAINTHIHTLPHRRTGALTAAFCSNDCSLRLLDITTNTFTSTFFYSHELNCAATSPDGRLRVVVGDMNDVLITDAERGDVLVTLNGEQSGQQSDGQEHSGHTDHAFATAWSPDGGTVVTGAQDGRVLIWDPRMWSKPVKALECELGCARSLCFTSHDDVTGPRRGDVGGGGGGLALVVAESDDYMSIYDAGGTGSWDRKQRFDFFGAVTGVVALPPCGSGAGGGGEIVVGNGDKDCGGLMVFERVKEGRCVREWDGTVDFEKDLDDEGDEGDLFAGAGGKGKGKKGRARKSFPDPSPEGVSWSGGADPERDKYGKYRGSVSDVENRPPRHERGIEEVYI